MKKRFLLLIALLTVLTLFPATALAADGNADGYNDNDFGKVQAFLNLPSANAGQTNGQVLNAAYNAADPATWTGVTWNADAEKRVTRIEWNGTGSLAGALDVSGCTALQYLDCFGNRLNSLDVSGCTALTIFYCDRNQLASLDVSGLAALVELSCFESQLTSLDVSGLTALQYLDCSDNQLTTLDVSGVPSLQYLGCSGNQLTSLDVSGFMALSELYCIGNRLTSLDVSGCAALVRLDCHENRLTSLDVSGLAALAELECYDNQLTSLNVSGCAALKYLDCNGNQLPSLNVSGLTALERLYCYENRLTALNVSGCTALKYLDCGNNLLASLDASDSPLMGIDTMSNQISGVKNGNPMTQLHIILGGSDFTMNAMGGGYVGFDAHTGTFVATELSPSTFINWTDAGGNVLSTDTLFPLGAPGTYDLTANFDPALALSASPTGGNIYPGDRITITPNYPGGTWGFDASLLSRNGNEFTAIKAGTARVTYTKGEQSAHFDVTISQALALTPSIADGRIYTGGHITITPNIAGGTWDFDASLLSRDGNEFTGIKAGTARVTYTVGAQSAYFDVIISQALALTPSIEDGKIFTGGRITITPTIAGGTWDFDASLLARSDNEFTGLLPGTARVTYTAGAQSAYFDITVSQALELTPSIADGKIFTGGRITITPNITGGTWDWDEQYLSATFNSTATFTGLKAGTTRVTYTVGGQSAYFDITISASELPSTGQDSTLLWLLCALGILYGCAAVTLTVIMKKRKARA